MHCTPLQIWAARFRIASSYFNAIALCLPLGHFVPFRSAYMHLEVNAVHIYLDCVWTGLYNCAHFMQFFCLIHSFWISWSSKGQAFCFRIFFKFKLLFALHYLLIAYCLRSGVWMVGWKKCVAANFSACKTNCKHFYWRCLVVPFNNCGGDGGDGHILTQINSKLAKFCFQKVFHCLRLVSCCATFGRQNWITPTAKRTAYQTVNYPFHHHIYHFIHSIIWLHCARSIVIIVCISQEMDLWFS